MKKIMIQFHATIEEIVEFINMVSKELGLKVSVMILKPFAIKEINDSISLGDIDLDKMIRVIFSKNNLNLRAISPNVFYDLNPDVINLDIGQLKLGGLEESALSFMSNNSDQIAIANKVASKLKKMTKSGVIAVNPETGDESMVKSNRYTAGAKEMYLNGIKILATGGFINFKLVD